MKKPKMNSNELALICLGLIGSSSTLLFKEWVPLPDYFRGFLTGLSLGLEIFGLILYNTRIRQISGCSKRPIHEEREN